MEDKGNRRVNGVSSVLIVLLTERLSVAESAGFCLASCREAELFMEALYKADPEGFIDSTVAMVTDVQISIRMHRVFFFFLNICITPKHPK